MKIKMIVFLLIVSFSVFGQTSVYHPFPTTNGNWDYRYYNDFGVPTSIFGGYKITGDTILSGYNYKKISGCGAQWSCDGGGIREVNKVIYFRPDTASTEYVLYDFNLSVGDTIIHPYGGGVCSNDTVTIWQEDSVLCSDGYHRQLLLSTSVIWIEGIGSLNYLLSPCNILCVSGNDFLKCMSGDSGFAYPFGTTSCFVSVPEQTNIPDNTSFFPNPFHSTTTLEMKKDFINAEIIIYNSYYEQVMRQKVFSQLTKINRAALTDGIYFYQVIGSTGKLETGRLIIQ